MTIPHCTIWTVFLLFVVISLAQGQTYVKLGFGYGFPLAGERLGTDRRQELTTTLDPQSGFQVPRLVTESESVHGSYGAGPLVHAAFGYMFTDQLGVEAMVSYVVGNEYEVTNTGVDSRLGQVVYDSRSTLTMSANGFFLAPMIKLTASEGMVRPYLMAGPVFGKVTFERSEHATTFDQGTTTTERAVVQYRGGLARGARGVIGVELALKSAFSVFVEGVITGMNYYPREAELTRYQVNDEDRLGTMTIRQRNAVFVNKVVDDTDEPIPSNDRPHQQARFSMPLSSLTANVGVKVSFGQ